MANISAQIHQAANQSDLARTEAQSALKKSQSCGYYWGQQDAQGILKLLN